MSVSKEHQKEFMARILAPMVLYNKREFTDEECAVYNSILNLIESSGEKEPGPHIAGELIERELAEDEKEPGVGEKISGSTNDASRPTPSHPSPGLTMTDEAALERIEILISNPLEHRTPEDFAALAHIKSRLSSKEASK